MTENTSETCEQFGSRILDDCCMNCGHQTCDCTCDHCIMAEKDDDNEGDDEGGQQ